MKKSMRLCLIIMVISLLNIVVLPNKISAEDIGEATVAMIGENKYDTLQEAFDSVPSNKKQTNVIVMRDFKMSTKDIATLDADKNVILNMNGKSITVDSTFVGRPIVNNGKLKVIGNGVIDSSMANSGYGAINNNGDLIIDNGTYSGYIYASGASIKNAGTLTINNGTFNKATCAIYNSEDGVVVINDGLFDTRSCSSCHKTSWSYTVRNFGTLTFNGGTVYGVQGALAIAAGKSKVNGGHFETLACDTHGVNTAFYALYVAGERGQTEAEINGGKFISASKEAVLVGNDNDGGEKLPATCIIRDGEFITKGSAKTPVITSAAKTGDPSISGGKFCKTINVEFLDLDYKLFENTDGTYNVIPKVIKLEFDKDSYSLEIGKKLSLDLRVHPINLKDLVTWTSSDSSVAVVDKAGNVTAKSTGKVEVIAEIYDLKVSSYISVYKVEKPVLPDIDSSKPSDEIQIGIQDDKSQKVISNSVNSIIDKIVNGETISNSIMSDETLNKFKEAIDKGESVKTIVDVKAVDKSMVNKEEINEINELIQNLKSDNSQISVGQYLDLSVFLKANNETLGTIHQLNDKITFTVMIPKDIQKENRKFYIIRIHEGKAERLETKVNKDGTVSFMTDKFSTYALVYEDIKNAEIIPDTPIKDKPSDSKNPVKTNDKNTIHIYITGVIVSMIVGVYIIGKKNRNY